MRFSPIAIALAAALLSLSAVAQEKKQESQSGQPPAMSQEQKPSTSQEQKPSTEAAAPAEKKEGSAAAGASAGGEAKGEAKGAASGETKAGQNPELIKQVQAKLNEQGHDVGAPDGKIGPKTQKGLKEFQTSKGIKASGQLDQQTLSALGVSESAAGGASKAETKAEKKAEGSAAAGASTSEEKKPESSAGAGASAGAAGSSTPEKKPDTPAAPAKTEKPGEKKY